MTPEMKKLLKELHEECLSLRVTRPSDLPASHGWLVDYLKASDALDDLLNAGEVPQLHALVADLFDDQMADAIALGEAIKRGVRAKALAAMDREYDGAKLGGLFAWDDMDRAERAA